jgi:starvation-inducible outer membrane lipoprotein
VRWRIHIGFPLLWLTLSLCLAGCSNAPEEKKQDPEEIQRGIKELQEHQKKEWGY